MVVASAAILFSLSSCKKDETNLPFSELSVEENKQVVENSAISAAQAIGDMKDLSVMDAIIAFGIRLDMADPLEAQDAKKSKVHSLVDVLAGLETGESGMHDVFTELRSPGALAEDPETIQEAWDMVVGTYSWNGSTDAWDYVANADAVVFKFPAEDDKINNNAVLTVSNYKGTIISNPLEGEYDGDLPVSLDMDMTIDNETVISFTFAVEYNDDGIPSAIAADLSIENYTLSADVTNNDKEVSASSTMKKDSEVIIELSGSAGGDFTQENIDANTVTYTDTYTDWVWDEATQTYKEQQVTREWEELEEPEEIVQSGKAKIRLYDISLVAECDIKALVDSMNLIYYDDYYDDPDWDDKTAAEQEASVINNNMQIVAVDETANTKIAEAEAYVIPRERWDGDYYYYVDLRLKFGDGSYVDLETYFEEGFDDFIKELNYIIVDLNSDYDLDIDLIDY